MPRGSFRALPVKRFAHNDTLKIGVSIALRDRIDLPVVHACQEIFAKKGGLLRTWPVP